MTVRHLAGFRFARLIGLTAASVATAAAPVAGQDAATDTRIDAVFARYDRPGSPGCALGVVQRGAFLVRRGYGFANLEHGIPNTPASVFRVGSSAKQFTAAAMVLLQQRGVLSLDDDIRRFLPELPEYEAPITVRHLLNHTSGIRDYLTLMYLAGKRSQDYYTDRDVLDMLARQRDLNFRPGAQYLYSNSGYFLLSQIVRRATGRSLREFTARGIFEPLGMGNTHFHDDHREIVPNRASGYAPTRGGFQISMTDLEMVGDGGLFTTVDDLAHWNAAVSAPSAIGGEAFLEEMHRRGVLNDGDTLAYALGLVHGRYRGLRTVGHGGAFVGFRSHFLRFPSEDTGVFVLCNVSTANPSLLARRVADVVLEDVLAPLPAPADAAGDEAPPTVQRGEERGLALTEASLGEFTGEYRSAELDFIYSISMVDGGLVLKMGNAYEGPLMPVRPNVFRAAGAPVTLRFYRTNDDIVSTFLLDAGRVRDLRFVRN